MVYIILKSDWSDYVGQQCHIYTYCFFIKITDFAAKWEIPLGKGNKRKEYKNYIYVTLGFFIYFFMSVLVMCVNTIFDFFFFNSFFLLFNE